MSIESLLIILMVFMLISALFNFLFLKWTKTLGTKNLPVNEGMRWSSAYKPAIGGISFYIIFLVSYVVYLFMNNPDLKESEELIHLGILIVVSLGFFTGLADDAFNTVPWLKLSAQIACGAIMLIFDIRIEFFDIIWADALLTVFWTVAVMNSINMLDNMDGITAVVSIFILLSAALAEETFSESYVFFTMICGGVMAAIMGFLIFNWHPAKIFMGDTGSQMIGALLSVVGILFFWNNHFVMDDHQWSSKIAIVVTAFVIPIADSLTVTINRIMEGRSPFIGGKDHTTHHLSYAGLNDGQVALIMLGIAMISTALIAGLKFIPIRYTPWYHAFLFVYSTGIIAFLFSSTKWKKSREVYLQKIETKPHK